MAKQLTNVEVDEVSLVTKGANQAARVLLFKRAFDGDELVSKCLSAIDSESYSSITKRDVEAALDALARQHADLVDTTYYEAYAEVVKSEVGSKLYNAMIAVEVAAAQREVDSQG